MILFQAALPNSDHNETAPVYSAAFGRRESRKTGKVLSNDIGIGSVIDMQ